LDLRGFSGAATFVRGVFDKIGIEPQVQRIGKYKSFGDTFNRTTISEAQREVVSSLLMEASDFWADHVGIKFNKSPEEVMKLWADQGIKTPYDFKDLGYITGVKYLDQVESMVKNTYKKGKKPGFWRWLLGKSAKDSEDAIVENDARAKDWSDFTLENEFLNNPRRNSMIETKELSDEEKKQKNNMIKKARQLKSKNQYSDGKFLAAGLYLRKMRKGDRILEGLQMREVRGGPRIVVINAVGGIGGGKSGSGVNGKSLGSDTLIEQVRQAKADPNVKAVIIRVDSPGGSALASDLMWREIRALSKEKPVIASMVDVAASGGYYIAMACDEIVAEELTITGSIGVVSSKFNAAELNEKIGFGTETISRGRYAEVLSTTRGFTQEEDDYFAESARKAYTSFITKAAASRNMSVEALNEVAQGRVWTGRQALNVGLVDHMGGINKALKIATKLADIEMKENSYYRVQTYREPKGGLPFPLSVLGGGATASSQGIS
jgi:signal peptide peptidase SppA